MIDGCAQPAVKKRATRFLPHRPPPGDASPGLPADRRTHVDGFVQVVLPDRLDEPVDRKHIAPRGFDNDATTLFANLDRLIEVHSGFGKHRGCNTLHAAGVETFSRSPNSSIAVSSRSRPSEAPTPGNSCLV